MNKLEKLVYDTVKSNPKIKRKIRNIYQSFFDILPNNKDFSIDTIDLKEGFFYGFHDISPFSEDDTKVLANKLTIPFRMPERNDLLEVGYFTFNNTNNKMDSFLKIGSSVAWNYHKGCRLQWAGKENVIYNTAIDNNLISCVYNLETKKERLLSFPIDTVSNCGNLVSTFSYGRLEYLMPGYGYASYDDESFNDLKIPENTGLFLGNIRDNVKELLISLKELTKIGELTPEYLECHHYVTHTLFSHDNRYVSFLHRWAAIDNKSKRHSRLLTYDLETKKCHVAPTNDMVSHYVWNNNNQIIAYCRTGNIDSHVLFEEPTLQKYKRIAYPKLNSDGHQSFITNNSFITDTYPDKYRMANLYKVKCDTNEVELVARLNSFKKFQSMPNKHWCCDLHPRMNHKGDKVCFDSVHTGKRALCILNI